MKKKLKSNFKVYFKVEYDGKIYTPDNCDLTYLQCVRKRLIGKDGVHLTPGVIINPDGSLDSKDI